MTEQRLLKRLSIAVGLFAITAATLIGIGEGSAAIPALVTTCVVTSWIFTDWLKWFQLHRYLVYGLMISGSILAIADYLRQSNHEQLYSVANLLVYAQLPLLFQQKSRRIFEQIGIFLLLELVVAALVNDNVIYGILLIPTLTIGGWVMVLYSNFLTESSRGTQLRREKNWRAKFLGWMGLEKQATPTEPLPLVLPSIDNWSRRPRWTAIGLPLSASFILFSGIYFYALPRLNRGAYGSTGFGQAAVGYSDSVVLEQVGKLAQRSTPIFRLEIEDISTDKPFRPNEPPYIRGNCLVEYRTERTAGAWVEGEYSSTIYRTNQFKLPAIPSDKIHEDGELKRVRVSEQSYISDIAFTLPPFYRDMVPPELGFDPDAWSLSSDRYSGNPAGNRRVYTYLTQAFTQGAQSPWIPESDSVFESQELRARSEAAPAPYDELSVTQYGMLCKWSASRFGGLIRFRDKALAKLNPNTTNVVDKAVLLREALASSSEFTYSLDLTLERDRLLDPIEDFVVNHKKGHCQYFASAYVMMLRSMGIPARVVIGYRPSDYNEVGKYFLVREMHAHAWVEAYFTREQCDDSRLIKIPARFKKGAWYRLDPTPSGNGSNAGRDLSQPTTQTLDFAQQLWRDYILNVDRSSQPSTFDQFNALSSNAYGKNWSNFRENVESLLGSFMTSLDSSPLAGWTMVLLLMAILTLVILASRVSMQWKSRKKVPRVTTRRPATAVTEEFYRRWIRSLRRFGVRREPQQTHLEFATTSADYLRSKYQIQDALIPFVKLTEAYYAMRYGGVREWSAEEWMEIEKLLVQCESMSIKPPR